MLSANVSLCLLLLFCCLIQNHSYHQRFIFSFYFYLSVKNTETATLWLNSSLLSSFTTFEKMLPICSVLCCPIGVFPPCLSWIAAFLFPIFIFCIKFMLPLLASKKQHSTYHSAHVHSLQHILYLFIHFCEVFHITL